MAIDLPLLEEGGNYAPRLTLLRGAGFGRVQLYLDGERLGQPLELGQEALAFGEEIRLEPRRLGAGAHRLTVEMLAAPSGGGTFGIDTI